jgi:hypothetical protein
MLRTRGSSYPTLSHNAPQSWKLERSCLWHCGTSCWFAFEFCPQARLTARQRASRKRALRSLHPQCCAISAVVLKYTSLSGFPHLPFIKRSHFADAKVFSVLPVLEQVSHRSFMDLHQLNPGPTSDRVGEHRQQYPPYLSPLTTCISLWLMVTIFII